MSFIDEYGQSFHGAKIELLHGCLIVGDSLNNSKILLTDMIRGWGIEAAICLVPESLWFEALQQHFGMPNSHDYTVLETWAEQLQYQPKQLPRTQHSWSWGYNSWRQKLRMALFSLGREAKLGDSCGHGVVNRLGDDAFMPDDYFYCGSPRNQMYEYYLDGPAEWVIEWVRTGLEDYTRQAKRARYQAAGVPELTILDAAQQRVELLRLVDGVYQVQHPDDLGRYHISSIPGLTFLPNQIWQEDEEIGFPLFGLFEVAEDASRKSQRESYVGEGIDWTTQLKDFPIGLEPVPIAFEDYIYWCPEAKFEFVNGKPWLGGGEEGGRGITGMLLMTFGLLDVVELAHPKDWIRGMKECFVTTKDPNRQFEWWKWARDSATFLKEHYGVDRVAVAGDLVTKGGLGVWSELVLVVWGLPPRDQRYTDVRQVIYAMNPDRAIRIVDAAKLGATSEKYLAHAIEV